MTPAALLLVSVIGVGELLGAGRPSAPGPVLVRGRLEHSPSGLRLTDDRCDRPCDEGVALRIPDPARPRAGVQTMLGRSFLAERRGQAVVVTVRARPVYTGRPPVLRRLELVDAIAPAP